ncbi:PTS fructose transporter subunit IIB [Atopobium fossor]|uniref:PTS fructose transporter subunit IIB n=1 Tax=Atopobium fossor TaxID=39487 RepID=UPI0004078437|nr:PTS fructose transporter subunit IIB [Atopobium fossor]
MKIVAVTACTVGIAHTFMAQKAIEDECEKRGFEYKVETQGGYGADNELDDDDIESADGVLLAVDVGIEGDERFDDKRDEDRVLTVGSADVIRDAASVIDRLLEQIDE